MIALLVAVVAAFAWCLLAVALNPTGKPVTTLQGRIGAKIEAGAPWVFGVVLLVAIVGGFPLLLLISVLAGN